MKDKSLLLFLRNYLAGQRGRVIVVVLFSIMQSLLLVPSFYFIRKIFDADIPHHDLTGLLVNSGIIIALTLVQTLATVSHRNAALAVAKSAVSALQRDVLRSLIWADKEFYDKTEGAKSINRAVGDIDVVDKMTDALLSVVIPQTTLFAIGVVLMIILNPLIGACTFVLGFTGFLLQRSNRKSVFQKIRLYSEAKDQVSSYVGFLPRKHVLTKMRNAEDIEILTAQALSDSLIDAGTSAARSGWKIKVTDELVVNISATILIVVGSLQILLGTASYGNIFGLYFLIVFIRRSVTYVQSSWGPVADGRVALARIFALIDPISTSQPGDNTFVSDQVKISIRNLSFGYGREKILDELNLEIHPGEIVNITGVNGAGKSSLINLLLGFYQPSTGSIFVNDMDYREIGARSIRSAIGYLPQEQVLIHGTIESNLMYGLSEAHQHLANLQATPLFGELMSGFPNGLSTEVETGGKNLSNGQIQRISILRALITEPKLLILDEPANHLDSAALQALVKEVRHRRTSMIVISHHDSFHRISDKTYALEKGKLHELKTE